MRYRIAALCLAMALLFAGCQIVSDTYVSISPHAEPFSQPDEEESVTVENDTELKNTILSLVQAGAEGAVLSASGYTGDLSTDFDAVAAYITESYPDGAYMVRSMKKKIVQVGPYCKLNLSIDYRHTPQELAAARYARGENQAADTIEAAMEECSERLLMRVSGYQSMDFEAVAAACFEENLSTIMAKPAVSAVVYPNKGSVRIVELRFTYPRPPAELRIMRSAVNTIMNSAYGYVRYGQSKTEQAFLLFSYLTERHDYELKTSDTPAYGLLCEGAADSRSFSAIYSAMCRGAGLNCVVVHGKKNGESYYWNILELDTGTCHVDILSDEQAGLREPQLLNDDQMAGYTWDREHYPKCDPVPPTPETSDTPEQQETTGEPNPTPDPTPEPEPSGESEPSADPETPTEPVLPEKPQADTLERTALSLNASRRGEIPAMYHCAAGIRACVRRSTDAIWMKNSVFSSQRSAEPLHSSPLL